YKSTRSVFGADTWRQSKDRAQIEGNVLPEKLLDLDSTKDLHPPLHVNPLSGSTTYSSSSSPNPFLEELADELALITFPMEYDDDLQFDVESDLKEIEFLLYRDIDSSLKDSIDQANPTDNFVDSMPEIIEKGPEYDDDILEVESDTENVYDDPFDSKGEKIKEFKLLIDELDLPCDFLPSDTTSSSSSSPNHLLEEFADELALITFLPRNDDLPFDIESDLKEIEYLLNHDPTKEMDSILEDLVDKGNLANPNVNLFDTIPEMFTDEHDLDYSSPPLYDEYDDDLYEIEIDNGYAYDDPFDSKGEKIKESKLLVDELDLSSDFLPSLEYDSFLFEDFSEVDALPSTKNEDKNVKKLAISHASLILEDFDPPLYELHFFKEVPGSETLLSFSFENEEKVFKPKILTSKGVHSSLILELSH
nr:hypothetical protein [Tanacetum cinerariifolium]